MDADDDTAYEYTYDEEVEADDEPVKTPQNNNTTTTLLPVSSSHHTFLSSSAPPPVKRSLLTADYRGLSPNDLKAAQSTLIKEVGELLNISEDNAAVLLIDFKWNREKLLDCFYSDPQGTRAKAGAIQGVIDVAGATLPRRPNTYYCPVLFEEVPFSKTLSMGCQLPGEPEHRVSLEAWVEYLVNAVTAQSMACIKSTCPWSGCHCVVSPFVWRLVLNPPDVTHTTSRNGKTLQQQQQQQQPEIESVKLNALTRYERFLASSFVDINKSIKWCPSPQCGWAIQSLGGRVYSVKCENCACVFCFGCGDDAHAPLSCERLKLWKEKCAGESETANWFVANTKKCPNCTTHIEKNQGCNHLHCAMCKHEFCWVCMGPWKEHGQTTGGYYACNRFEDPNAKKSNTDVAKAKRELDRYIHYYTRYQTHQQSLKFANKQRIDAEARMTSLQQQGGQAWVDVQFISEACEQLVECRRVLMYTYAYAYLLPDGPRKELFEFNQAMLEGNTEKLSELSEVDPLKMQRSEVINYTRVTGSFLKKLLEQVQDEELYGSGGAGFDDGGATTTSTTTTTSTKKADNKVPPLPNAGKKKTNATLTGRGGKG